MSVLLIDHQSRDRTASIARAAGARVITRPFEGFVEARLFALGQVETPWVLMIDADEALDGRLRTALQDAAPDAQAYLLSRDTYYCGKALRMWRGEPLLRLFKTGSARLEARPAAGGIAQLHERWVTDAPAAQLPGTLLHYSYESRRDYDLRFAQYTRTEAEGITRSAVGIARETLNVAPRFFRNAFLRGAVLDGAPGLYVAWRSALYPAAVQWQACR